MATAPATHADDALLESILSLLTAYLHSGVTLPEECHRTLFAVTVHPLSTLLNRAPDLEGKAPVFDISSSVLYVRAELRSGVSGGFPVTHASVMLRPRQRPSLRCAILAFVTAFMKRDEGVAGAFVSFSDACNISSVCALPCSSRSDCLLSLSLCGCMCDCRSVVGARPRVPVAAGEPVRGGGEPGRLDTLAGAGLRVPPDTGPRLASLRGRPDASTAHSSLAVLGQRGD